MYDSDQVALTFGNTGSLTHRYLHGPAIDQVLADEQLGNDLFWTLVDHLGSVRDVIDNSATVLKHLAYDSFGKIVTDTNPNLKIVQAYTGREFEAIVGLQYNRARWYDHNAGRWINTDPIQDGLNWYAYVENGPLTATDPWGLQSRPPIPYPRDRHDTIDGRSRNGIHAPDNELGPKHWFEKTGGQPRNDGMVALVGETATGERTILGTVSSWEAVSIQQMYDREKGSVRFWAGLGIVGDIGQIVGGGVWILGTKGAGAVAGGGFLMGRGLDGLRKHGGEWWTGIPQESVIQGAARRLAQMGGASGETSAKVGASAEFAAIMADVLVGLKAQPKLPKGQTFTIPLPKLSSLRSIGGPGGGAAVMAQGQVLWVIEHTTVNTGQAIGGICKVYAVSIKVAGAGGMGSTPGRPGQPGNPDHVATVRRLRERAQEEFKGRNVRIHESKSIKDAPNAKGLDRRPDVWVQDADTLEVLRLYEAARKNAAGEWVTREGLKIDDYKRLGLDYTIQAVRP